MNAEKYFVYNRTRERFVATDVEAADASPEGAEARLRSLEQGAGIGLWILPYLGISPTSIRFPLDLVFLDHDCVVLAIVESFPLGSLPAASAKALSALALPADTATEGEMRVGDQLIVCEPDEMKRHLQRMKEAKAEGQGSVESIQEQIAVRPHEEQTGAAAEGPTGSAVEQEPATPGRTRSTGIGLVEPVHSATNVAGEELPTAAPARVEFPFEKQAKSRGWFTRLLLGDPKDPRQSTRDKVPGLIAHFFTGGAPVAHEVRDISSTGMYIVTHDRWYPGTMIRVTLTDRNRPTPARTITVNAKAVRWGSDGVGLEFVLTHEKQKGSKMLGPLDPTLGLDAERVEAFLLKLKAASSHR